MARLFLLAVALAISMPAAAQADLSGKWSGAEWGDVTLERIGAVSYAGTYSTTFKKDVGRVTFSLVAGKYEGKWWEGTFRIGTLTLEASRDGRSLSGVWTTSSASSINPGEPKSAQLRWTRK